MNSDNDTEQPLESDDEIAGLTPSTDQTQADNGHLTRLPDVDAIRDRAAAEKVSVQSRTMGSVV